MSKPSNDELNAYGCGGHGAADAAAAQTIANNWKHWKKFLGDTGKLALTTASVWWNASKVMDFLPIPPEWNMGVKLAVSTIPALWKTVTDKEWRESFKHVAKHTKETVQNYAHKVATKVREAAHKVREVARKVGNAVRSTLKDVCETAKSVYESAKIATIKVTQRTSATVGRFFGRLLGH